MVVVVGVAIAAGEAGEALSLVVYYSSIPTRNEVSPPPPPKSQKIRLFCMDRSKGEESTELDESLLSKSSIDVYKNDTVRVIFRFLVF